MKTAQVALALAVILIVAGAVWYTRSPESPDSSDEETAGAYVYTCDKGLEFVLVPAADLSAITLHPVADMAYPPVSVLADSPTDSGRRYRNADFEFHGQGERVTLYATASGMSYTCAPQPKPDEPPLNWGDSSDAPMSKIDITVGIGQSGDAFGETITVQKVLEDSRCPRDVQCVWAGTVRLEGTVLGGMGLGELVFELGKTSTTEVNAITFTSVSPAPQSGNTIRESDYRFTFEVARRSVPNR